MTAPPAGSRQSETGHGDESPGGSHQGKGRLRSQGAVRSPGRGGGWGLAEGSQQTGRRPGAPGSRGCRKGWRLPRGRGQKLPGLLCIMYSGARLPAFPAAGSPGLHLCPRAGLAPVRTRTCRRVSRAGRWRFQPFPFQANSV